MPEIRPFAGIRYSEGVLSGDVLAPPFDVISDEDRRELAARSPRNIVLLDKGPAGHDATWYDEAAVRKDQWLAEGVLQRDNQPAFYGYRQRFEVAGSTHVRTGFVAAVRLAPWGAGIFPHEKTRTGDRTDRLNLTRAMRANLSPVFGLYRDSDGLIDAHLRPPSSPLLEDVSLDGVSHTFWRIDDPGQIQRLRELMASQDIVIADGHHRYETALAYQKECEASAQATDGAVPYDYVMMYLTNACSPGLVILPTHRIVSVPDVDQEKLLHDLARTFDIYPVWDQAELGTRLAAAAEGSVAMAMATQDMGTFLLRMRPDAHIRETETRMADDMLAGLDVMVLQERVLEPLLGISREALAASASVSYTIDAEQALQAVRLGKAQLSFLLNATTTDQVWQAATAGTAMPQKSTYFYPKLLTGLVINPLNSW